MVFFISKLVHVFIYIFLINSPRNTDCMETAVFIPSSDFVTEIIVLGLKKPPVLVFKCL